MIGQPTRYTHLIFAENEEESPWESFAVEHAFSPEDSTVTLDEMGKQLKQLKENARKSG